MLGKDNNLVINVFLAHTFSMQLAEIHNMTNRPKL